MYKNILVIEDQPSQLRLAESLIDFKINYLSMVHNRNDKGLGGALAGLNFLPDVVIIDITAPINTYTDTIRTIKSYKPQIPIIALTQFSNEELATQAILSGANDYIVKPVGLDRLKLTIKNVLKIQNMSISIARLERYRAGHITFADVIGSGSPMKSAIAQGQMAASSNFPVWIEGEHGTGKEFFARAIHGSGKNIGSPFVVIDCAHLMGDSEKSDSADDKMADVRKMILMKIQQADGGTLYMKEINALPIEVQKCLLEMFEANILSTSDSNISAHHNIRIIVGSSKPFGDMAVEGVFGALLKKLYGMIISLPALRDRKSDIPELSKHFISVHTASENKIISKITDDAIKLLENNPWHGNIIQLAGTIQRAVLMCHHGELDAGTIRLVQQLEPVNYTAANDQSGAPTLLDMRGRIKKLKSIEEEVIRFALENSGGSMSRAARNLGIGRSTLYRKISGMASGSHISRENQTTRPIIEASVAEHS